MAAYHDGVTAKNFPADGALYAYQGAAGLGSESGYIIMPGVPQYFFNNADSADLVLIRK